MQRPDSVDGPYSSPNVRSSLHWLILAFFGVLVHHTYALREGNATYPQSTANASYVKNEFVVFSGNTTQQSQQLIASLRSILGSGDIAEYGGIYTGPQFWLVQMTSTQISRLLKSIPGAEVYKNEVVAERQMMKASNTESVAHNVPRKLNIDKPNIVYQEDAPKDLKVVSWAEGKDFDDNDLKYYAYDKTGGHGSVLYVAENGIDIENEEFVHTPATWRYAPGAIATPTDDEDGEHGTCMVSRAIGNRFGVSKQTPLIILKTTLRQADILWAFQSIVNDLGANPAMRAVILIAFSSIRVGAGTNTIPQPWRRVRTLMLEAIARNAVFVVASGNGRNGAEHRFVRSYPAFFAYPQTGSVPLTLVGAVDDVGIEAPFSKQSSHISAWAPGVDARCANTHETARWNGTSISAAMVAGLAAYFLGFPNPPFDIGGGRTALNFNWYLREKASWQRSPEGVPRVIWNLQDGSSMQPLLNVSETLAASDVASA